MFKRRLPAYLFSAIYLLSTGSELSAMNEQEVRRALGVQECRRERPCASEVSFKAIAAASTRQEVFTDIARYSRFKDHPARISIGQDWAEDLPQISPYSYSHETQSMFPLARVIAPTIDLSFCQLSDESIESLRNNPPPYGYDVVVNTRQQQCFWGGFNRSVMTQAQINVINASWTEIFAQEHSLANRLLAQVYKYRYIIPLLGVGYFSYRYAQKNMPDWIAQRASEIVSLKNSLATAENHLAMLKEVIASASTTSKEVILNISAQDVADAFNGLAQAKDGVAVLRDALKTTAEWGIANSVVKAVKDSSVHIAASFLVTAFIDRYIVKKCLAYKPIKPARLVVNNSFHGPFCNWFYDTYYAWPTVYRDEGPCCQDSVDGLRTALPLDDPEENQKYARNRKIATFLAGAALGGVGAYMGRDIIKTSIATCGRFLLDRFKS